MRTSWVQKVAPLKAEEETGPELNMGVSTVSHLKYVVQNSDRINVTEHGICVKPYQKKERESQYLTGKLESLEVVRWAPLRIYLWGAWDVLCQKGILMRLCGVGIIAYLLLWIPSLLDILETTSMICRLLPLRFFYQSLVVITFGYVITLLGTVVSRSAEGKNVIFSPVRKREMDEPEMKDLYRRENALASASLREKMATVKREEITSGCQLNYCNSRGNVFSLFSLISNVFSSIAMLFRGQVHRDIKNSSEENSLEMGDIRVWCGNAFFMLFFLILYVILPWAALGSFLIDVGLSDGWGPILSGMMVMFYVPFVLRSVFLTGSLLEPVELAVWKDLIRYPGRWVLFYLFTYLYLWAALILGMMLPQLGGFIGVLSVLFELIWARMFGRMLWYCDAQRQIREDF